MSGKSSGNPGRILVVYYSVSGNTARVARDIARLTRADVESLRDTRHCVGFMGYVRGAIDSLREKPAEIGPLGKNPRDYALTIIGTPVWVGRMTPAARAYLQRVSADLGKVAFFVTSGNTDIGKIAPGMEKLAGREAIACAGFNARELADQEVYRKKLNGFVAALMEAPAAGEAPAPTGARSPYEPLRS